MLVRGMVVRLVEWRAEWFSDPARRLQYLQREMTRQPQPKPTPRQKKPLSNATKLAIGFVFTLAFIATALLRPETKRLLGRTLAAISLPALRTTKPRTNSTPILHRTAATEPARVWLVESTADSDLYSNGLRIQKQYLTGTQPRAYVTFPRDRIEPSAGQWRFQPAGVVFHTTESHMAPFEEDHTQTLRRDGEGMLEYVRRNRSYHFVIDRFGQVFRIVRESDYANHAGHSIWADEKTVYINLNQSFLGIAFEAQSRHEDEGLPVNPAQVHAGRILTEMLRAIYGIPEQNCVAHAQVSVNPANLRAGFHVDWAANLPFHDLGLSDNYRQPLPSVLIFGFGVDNVLAGAGGESLRQALQAAEDQLRDQAAAQNMPLNRYRETLQKKYREAHSALHAKGLLGENNS